jgi:predicted ATPase
MGIFILLSFRSLPREGYVPGAPQQHKQNSIHEPPYSPRKHIFVQFLFTSSLGRMIERVIIDNFKSIRYADVTLGPINVLIGANGAGKSNLCAFFRMIRWMSRGNLQEYAGRYGAENLLHYGVKGSDYMEGLIDFDNTNAYYFRLEPTPDNRFIFTREGNYFNGYNYTTKDYTQWHDDAFGALRSGQRESYVLGSQSYRDQRMLQYLNAFQVFHFHDTSEQSKLRKPCPIDDNQYLRENGENLPAILYFLQEKEPEALRWIEGVVRSIAPFFDRFVLQPRRLDPDTIQLVMRQKGSDAYFDSTYLSDGTLRFIALATLLLQPALPKTIIVDEPELGLHPAAIQKLAVMLRSAAQHSQIILSTQSVSLVDEFEPEEIIAVDQQDGHSIFSSLDPETLESWLKDYTMGDLWNKNVIGARP